jgi:hypothetical protein
MRFRITCNYLNGSKASKRSYTTIKTISTTQNFGSVHKNKSFNSFSIRGHLGFGRPLLIVYCATRPKNSIPHSAQHSSTRVLLFQLCTTVLVVYMGIVPRIRFVLSRVLMISHARRTFRCSLLLAPACWMVCKRTVLLDLLLLVIRRKIKLEALL